MIRTSFTFGLLAGLIIVGLGALAFKLVDPTSSGYGEVVGYATMLVGLSLTYFGVKRYRDEHQSDAFTFGTAFKVGLGIILVASMVYVVSWMLSFYAGNGAEMMEGYFNAEISNIQQSELTAKAKAIKLEELEAMRTSYVKPHNMAMITLLEIFPVGLLVSLLTAWLLKTR